MPSGKDHIKINFTFLPVFIIVLISLGFSSLKYGLLFSIGFAFGTLFLDPDLDTHGNSFRRWGILKSIWIPYQRTFPHRSIFTHGIIIGDLIRIIYLCIWIFLLFIFPVLMLQDILKLLFAQYSFVEHLVISLATFLLLSTMHKSKTKRRASKRRSRWHLITLMLTMLFLETTGLFSVLDFLSMQYENEPYNVSFFVLGILLSSTLHTVSDILFSSIKKIL